MGIKNIIHSVGQALTNYKATTNPQNKKSKALLVFGLIAKGVNDNTNTSEINTLQTKAEIDEAVKTETKEILGAEFSNNTQEAAFNDEEISLDNLMALLDNSLEPVDKEKLDAYNKQALESKDRIALSATEIDSLKDAGFDEDLINELMENTATAGSVKFIAEAIENGSFDRISNKMQDYIEYGNPSLCYLIEESKEYAFT